MGRRPTQKAGLPKLRTSDLQLQRSLDAIVERLEILDGIRGDTLDSAVTYRALGDSGFDVRVTSGGTIVTPGTGGGGGIDPGPAGAPTALAVNETFLALLLTWANSAVNLQHVEVWRALTDNLSLAVFVGTTVSPQYLDYVGASQTYYYWVRSVGTDGTFSAYNDTAGTVGTTGIDPSDFEVEINTSTSNLDAALAARIDLIDFPVTGLVDRTAAAEGDIIALDSRTDTLEIDVGGLVVTVDGQTTSINTNTSNISTNQTSITVVGNDLDTAEEDILGNTTAISVNASSILNLEAAIGALDAEGGETWDFNGTDESWTAVNASIVPSSTYISWTPSAANPQLISPGGLTVSGGIYTQVVVRVRMNIAGGAWEGNVYYETAGHGISSSHVKTIADPSLSLSEWTTLTWDMADLTNGGTDWIDSTITKIRVDLVSTDGGTFHIDWIQVAKYSSTAISEAISALDVRVGINESGVSANASDITALQATVNDNDDGVQANVDAISALTIDVNLNTSGVSINASDIVALQTTVDDPVAGVVVNASAITILEADVSTVEGSLVAQASEITQLTASVQGAFGSVVNSLLTLGEGFGTTFDDSDIQSYADVGLRTGVAGKITGSTDLTETVYRSDGARLRIEPRGIYEVRFSIYHDRPTTAGTFLIGLQSFAALTGGSAQSVIPINDGVLGTGTSTPHWLSGKDAVGDNEWLDVVCFILGPDAVATDCPNMLVNGDPANTAGFATFTDGYQVDALYPYVELKLKNFNTSPTYGDDATTTLWTTDLQVRRVDSSANLFAAIQTEAVVRASETGDLNALYAVQVQLSTGDDPYITGFGLAADVIDGVATSAFGIRADQFFITSPTFGDSPGGGPGDNAESSFPFIVDLVEGVATVAINGALIVDGTIRGNSIIADTIGVREIQVTSLSAIEANMGILTSGLIRTALSPAYRVELEDQASTNYPLWYGTGAKSEPNARFYVDEVGNVVVRGLLEASVIRQSFFAPAGTGLDPFRIATQYPDFFSAGNYTGKKAALFSSYALNLSPNTLIADRTDPTPIDSEYTSPTITFIGPTEGSTAEYGRLGTTSEMITIDVVMECTNIVSFSSAHVVKVELQYEYDGAGVRTAFYWTHVPLNSTTKRINQVFVTKGVPFDELKLSVRVSPNAPAQYDTSYLRTLTIIASTPNFGVSNAAILTFPDDSILQGLAQFPRWVPA